jgi:hypothetical protein
LNVVPDAALLNSSWQIDGMRGQCMRAFSVIKISAEKDDSFGGGIDSNFAMAGS